MLSVDAVLALAPDESSAKAAKGLLGAGQWPLLGASAEALWGECKGSGAKPYQTQVDLAGPAFRCSCPSRKFPCKHGLALLLQHVQQPERFEAAPAPAWVTEWLQGRAEKAAKQADKAANATPAVAADPQASAQREAKRWQRIDAGVRDLQLWLSDQLRQGLAAVAGQTDALRAWHSQAARLVDAQAPGLAQRVQQAAGALEQGTPGVLAALRQLGLLQLATEAVLGRERLPAEQQHNLRALLGWPLDRAEWLGLAAAVDDTWFVLGVVLEEREDKLTERRVWLQALQSGARALLVDHSHGGRGFDQSWFSGTALQAVLHPFPGAGALRALCSVQRSVPQAGLPFPQPLVQPIANEWASLAQRQALNPWQPLQPLCLAGAVPLRHGDAWAVQVDGGLLSTALSESDAWMLLACSGGQPLTLGGEWDGQQFAPFSAWDAQGLVWQRGGGQ